MIFDEEWKQERHFYHKCYVRYWITVDELEQLTQKHEKKNDNTTKKV